MRTNYYNSWVQLQTGSEFICIYFGANTENVNWAKLRINICLIKKEKKKKEEMAWARC